MTTAKPVAWMSGINPQLVTANKDEADCWHNPPIPLYQHPEGPCAHPIMRSDCPWCVLKDIKAIYTIGCDYQDPATGKWVNDTKAERDAMYAAANRALSRTIHEPEHRPECICPNCGLRHGGSNFDGVF